MPNWSKAGYSSFDDCVAKNSDKGNPKAYCGEIRKQLECPSEIFEDERPPKDWFEDCVSSVSGTAANPEALCNWIWHHMHEQVMEAYRHRDFQRIHDEFVNYYKNSDKGESEYYSWLKALNLNEEREYSQAQESFKWAKNMLQYLREDDENKYYKVLIGFPIKSMNGNVYKERDLIAAALTLKGTHPTLNHKNQWHFTPDSRWGEITTEDARYEDGATEAILRVSKQAVCPICDGKPMTELIDSNRIVNVSLQGGCANAQFGGVCDGFQYDDKGFSLLTSDVLPGIPMARIFPLEHIMVEALQTSTEKKNKMKKKIVMEVLEQDDDGPRTDAERAKAHFKISDEDWSKLSDEEKQAYIDKLPPRGSAEQLSQVMPVSGEPTDKTVEPDEHGQCPEGMRINALGKCVATEECPENQHWSAEANNGQGGCVADSTPKPETPETAVGKAAAPREDILTMGPTEQPTPEEQPPVTGTDKIDSPPPVAGEEPTVTGHPPEPLEPMQPTEPGAIKPKEPHTCPDGHHYDPELNQCVPDEPIVERVKRIKAENRAKNAEEAAANWELHYVKMNKQYNVQTGVVQEQARTIGDLQKQSQTLNEKRLKLQGELNEEQRETGRLHSQIRNMQEQMDKLKTHGDSLGKKYENAVSVNLELSRKNVKANEDYLESAARIEYLEAQLKKAKDIGKKLRKIRVKV